MKTNGMSKKVVAGSNVLSGGQTKAAKINGMVNNNAMLQA